MAEAEQHDSDMKLLSFISNFLKPKSLASVCALGGFLVLKWAWAKWNERNETSDKKKTTTHDDDDQAPHKDDDDDHHSHRHED